MNIVQYIRSTLQRRYIVVGSFILLILVIGAYSMVRCHDKIGDPFLGFFYGENLVVAASQRSEWPGIQHGIKPLDRIITVNDKTFENGEKLAKYLWLISNKNPPQVTIELERGQQRYNVTYPLPKYTLSDFLVIFVAPCTLGGLFLLLGSLAFFLRPRYRVTLIYFYFCALISLASVIHFEAFSGFELYRLMSFQMLIGAASLQLFAHFPERSRYTWLKNLIRFNYLIVLCSIAVKQLYFDDTFVTTVISYFDAAYLTMVILADFSLLLLLYKRTAFQRTRDKLKVLFIGLAIATPLLLYWSIGFIFSKMIFNLDQAMILFLIFPLFLGYAVIRKNIFDIDRVIRNGVSYGILAGGLLTLFMIVISFFDETLPIANHRFSPWIFFMTVIVSAIVIAKSFDVVQWYIMRHVFRGRYNVITTLKEMIEKLSHTTRYEEIQNIIVNSLVSRLRLSGATFLDYSEFSAQQAYQAESCLGMDAKALEAINWSDLLPKIPQPYAVLTFDNLIENKILNLHEAKLFRKNSVQVLVKIDTRKRQPAILLLGNRRGDKELTSETLGIIKTIAKQASISLENAYLYRREAARERLAALGKVASIMIHEIKNPLGIIRVSNETLKKRYSKDATSFELATIIDDEISRMDQTIQKILNFAKPDPLALKSFDPKELIHDVTRKLRPEFEQASIELQFENNFNQSVLADSEKMRRILYNLLLNAKAAYKTTSSTDPTTPKRIVISTSNSQERFCLKIADNGEGIDEKTLHNIFQPFFTTNTGSTGLGLAIVQQIVSDHHGEILVNSKPGVGTSFEIYFPMNRSAIDFSSQFV